MSVTIQDDTTKQVKIIDYRTDYLADHFAMDKQNNNIFDFCLPNIKEITYFEIIDLENYEPTKKLKLAFCPLMHHINTLESNEIYVDTCERLKFDFPDKTFHFKYNIFNYRHYNCSRINFYYYYFEDYNLIVCPINIFKYGKPGLISLSKLKEKAIRTCKQNTITFFGRQIDNVIKSKKASITQLEKYNECYIRSIDNNLHTIAENKEKIAKEQKKKIDLINDYEDILEKVKAMPVIQDVNIRQNAIILTFVPSRIKGKVIVGEKITDKGTFPLVEETLIPIGQLQFTVTTDVTCDNIDLKYKSKGLIHPHVFDYGMCMGEFSTVINKAVNNADLIGLVNALWGWMNGYNNDSDHYRVYLQKFSFND